MYVNLGYKSGVGEGPGMMHVRGSQGGIPKPPVAVTAATMKTCRKNTFWDPFQTY